jgi:hypothetical protein
MYSGSTDFAPITSAAVSAQVEDFSLKFAAGSITSVTVLPGGTATYSLAVSPGSTTFPAAITLSASGLPSGAVAVFTPAVIAAGSGSTNVTLTIQAPSTSAALRESGPWQSAPPIYLGVFLSPFAGLRRRWMHGTDETPARCKSSRRRLLLLAILSLATLAGIAGCGFKDGYFGQQQRSYSVTITGAAGALSHSASAQLTVE